ncbi:MAG TPA: hypothetical protein VLS90_12365, partial [Thermodesulfobacteriota bacterium]|nr:hypothetical protein [Thermodesulfobacteriota bacterium]
MKKFALIVGCIVLVSFAAFSGCRTAPDLVQVKMDYTPTNLVTPPKTQAQHSLFIAPVEDKRKTPDQIGENTEKPKIVPVKTQASEVPAFVENAFKTEFRKAGFNLMDAKGDAQRVLKVTLSNLWVDEK